MAETSTSKRLAIFPASGGLGGGIYHYLFEQRLISPIDVVLISRNPGKVPEKYKAAGVTTRQADYDKPETLTHAFEGVSYLMLISYASIEHEHRANVHKLAIDAARASGVRHIFYSSLAYAGDGQSSSAAFVMQAHLDTEAYLASLSKQDPSFTYTSIREGIYTEAIPIYTSFLNFESPAETICIPHSGSGPGVAWAKRDELAEASARLIAAYTKSPNLFPHTNKTVLLSGSQAWSLSDTVGLIGNIVGKKISIQEVSLDAYLQQPHIESAKGYGSGDRALRMATAFDAMKQGETAVVSPLLAQLLGREPESLEVTLKSIVNGA
ncbi:hypothetical protein AAFC00_002644 [Neodothiora populina]